MSCVLTQDKQCNLVVGPLVGGSLVVIPKTSINTRMHSPVWAAHPLSRPAFTEPKPLSIFYCIHRFISSSLQYDGLYIFQETFNTWILL